MKVGFWVGWNQVPLEIMDLNAKRPTKRKEELHFSVFKPKTVRKSSGVVYLTFQKALLQYPLPLNLEEMFNHFGHSFCFKNHDLPQPLGLVWRIWTHFLSEFPVQTRARMPMERSPPLSLKEPWVAMIFEGTFHTNSWTFPISNQNKQ